jgi:Concanavalin A-like lectin/glucanases superfamily
MDEIHPLTDTMNRISVLIAGLCAAAIPFTVAAQTPVSPGAALQHRYSFNTDARDSVGHADGTLEGAAVISGGQVHLDGTRGTYVNLPGGLIAGDKAVTFEFWATLGANGNWCRVFDQGSEVFVNGGRMDLYFSPHSGVRDFRLTVMDPNPTERVIHVRGNLDHQTNLCVACVLDPPSGFMGIYTNGILAVSTNTLTSLESVSTNRFYLGRSLFPSDAPLNGSIDEFRIYNTALSPAQVAEDFKNGPDVVPK